MQVWSFARFPELPAAASTVAGPAATVADLFEGVEPEDLLIDTTSRFGCSPMGRLSCKVGPRCRERPIGRLGIHTSSKPCRLSECVVFGSHSWHDDGQQNGMLSRLDALTSKTLTVAGQVCGSISCASTSRTSHAVCGARRFWRVLSAGDDLTPFGICDRCVGSNSL